MADIKKKIDLEVNSTQIEKKLSEVRKRIEQITTNLAKDLKDFQRAQRNLLDIISKIFGVEKEITKEKEKQANIQNKSIDNLKQRLEFSRRLRDLETPKMSFLEYGIKYQGAAGGFRRISDYITQKGERQAEIAADAIQVQEEEYKNIVSTQGEDSEAAQQKNTQINKAKEDRSKAIGEYKGQANKYAALAVVAQRVSATFDRLNKRLINFLTRPFKDLYEGVKKVVQSLISFNSGVATFATNTSLITNAAAREQQIRYGLTNTQNYGFTKAKEMLNIQSDEDLMYMNADQRERFLGYMERYSQWYDEMESSGVLESIQEMQLEFNELKEQLAMEFLQWVAANKETIMTAIRGIFEFIKIVAKVIVDIINFLTSIFGGRSSYSLSDFDTTSDLINNNNNSRNTNITINANTTNNATGVLGSQEAMNQWSQENWANLAKQVVGVIGG